MTHQKLSKDFENVLKRYQEVSRIEAAKSKEYVAKAKAHQEYIQLSRKNNNNKQNNNNNNNNKNNQGNPCNSFERIENKGGSIMICKYSNPFILLQ